MSEENSLTETISPEKPKVRELQVSNLDIKKLIQLQGCTRCGECLNWCPVYDQDMREAILPRKKIQDFLRIVKSQHGLLARIIKSGRVGDPLKKLLAAVFGYQEVGPGTDGRIRPQSV